MGLGLLTTAAPLTLLEGTPTLPLLLLLFNRLIS